MKTVYVVCSRPAEVKLENILGHLICEIEGVGYSHVSFFFHEDTVDRDVIYESTIFGIDFSEKQSWMREHHIVKSVPIHLSPEQFKKFYQFLWDNEGNYYGVLQILGQGLKRLFGAFGVNIRNPFTSGADKQPCFETICLALQDLEIVEKQDWDDMGLREFDVVINNIRQGQVGE